MEVAYPGHRYLLHHTDSKEDSGHSTVLQFVMRPPHHHPCEGVTNQEVLRALIDRVKVLDAELPWEGNSKILHHLRMALVLHEARALDLLY